MDVPHVDDFLRQPTHTQERSLTQLGLAWTRGDEPPGAWSLLTALIGEPKVAPEIRMRALLTVHVGRRFIRDSAPALASALLQRARTDSGPTGERAIATLEVVAQQEGVLDGLLAVAQAPGTPQRRRLALNTTRYGAPTTSQLETIRRLEQDPELRDTAREVLDAFQSPLTSDDALLEAFQPGFVLRGHHRIARVDDVRTVGELRVQGSLVLFDAVMLEELCTLTHRVRETSCSITAAIADGRVALVRLDLGPERPQQWQSDKKFASSHGSTALVSHASWEKLNELERSGAFAPHGYFSHVVDANIDYRDDEARVVEAEGAPPIFIFNDKQMGGTALWGLSPSGEPCTLILDLFRNTR